MHSNQSSCSGRGPGPGGWGEAWRIEREMKRAAWRARRAARRASRGEWGHFGDPKFWGLDQDSMKQWGFGGPDPSTGSSPQEIEALKVKVADMERTMAAMHQRIIVLEKLIVDDDAHLSREIEKLRGAPGKGAE